MLLQLLRALFAGNLDQNPAVLTAIQSGIVTCLAAIMAAVMWIFVGVHYANVWYQICAALLIAAVLAPVFLYPSYRAAHRLRAANAQIRQQAETDDLTGLPNAVALTRFLDTCFASEKAFAVFFLDINRFKNINDSLGHNVGNGVLAKFAHALQEKLSDALFVARFGGDEFVVVQAVQGEIDALEYARRISNAAADLMHIGEEKVFVSATVGIALAPAHGTNGTEILKAADIALYKAKGRSLKLEIFRPTMAMRASRNMFLERLLREATASRAFTLNYQPIVLRRNPLRTIGFEALLRWTLDDGESISPDEFIPIAERSGMIVEIGRWVIAEACREARHWPKDTKVSVNISPSQLLKEDFLEVVSSTLEETGIEPSRLELEITENVLLDSSESVMATIASLRALGVRVALDDFGSGYCGLRYLRDFTIDKIKIDKTIIDEAVSSEHALRILKAVTEIATQKGMVVTVEGIDSIEKAALLNAEGCGDEVQGFLFGKPMPSEAARRFANRSAANGASLPDGRVAKQL